MQHHLAKARGKLARRAPQRQKQAGQGQADGRTRRSHQRRPHWGGTFAIDAGNTAQQKQGDAAHLHPLAEGDQGMAQLVQKHRNEQQQGCQEGQAPNHQVATAASRVVVALKGHRGDQQDDQPGGVNTQGNAPKTGNLPTFSHCDRAGRVIGRLIKVAILARGACPC